MKLINKIRQLLNLPEKVNSSNSILHQLKKQSEHQLELTGKYYSQFNKANCQAILDDISLSEFKIYSQWGDDGIIQFLINYLDIENKTFIEFGVENYTESNTRFLLINDNWSGLVLDGSERNIQQVVNSDIYWKYDITAKSEFITCENINAIIKQGGFKGDIGLLSIDIDGNDYWIWKQIDSITPCIVIVEYNSIFGSENPWTIPYKKDFQRTAAHFSNLYYGTSLLSICDLAEEKGYSFVGCNSNGNNAYFIRKDKMKELRKKTAHEGFRFAKFRESRDMNGSLTFHSGKEKTAMIKGCEVFNTHTNKLEII